MSFRSTKTPFKYMKQFKAVAIDYEYYLSLEDIGRLYCLTDRQIYVLLGQMDYVCWLTRWYNTEDITQQTVVDIQSELMEKLMSCVDISILVDQANLNLVDSVTSNQIQSQALRDALEDQYTGTPTSINPSAPTTNFGSSGDRFDALCAGLTAFVYQFARAQADSARAAQVGGLAAVALIALLLIPGLNFFFVVGASIAVAAGLGTIGVSLVVAIAALTDQAALNAVICYMRDTLKAQSVTQANWNACLNTYPFGVGTHEAIICDFIKPMLPANYLTILNILGQAYDGTINGDAMPECPCAPPVEDCNDLTAGNFTWFASNSTGTPSADWGVYFPGQGLGPQQTFKNFYWRRPNSAGAAIMVSSVTFKFNAAITNFRFDPPGPTGFQNYTGPVTTEITYSEATHPAIFPIDLRGDIRISFIGEVAPTIGFRMTQFCWEPV